MKFKNISSLCSAVVALSLAAVLAGCGNQSAASGSAADAESAEEVSESEAVVQDDAEASAEDEAAADAKEEAAEASLSAGTYYMITEEQIEDYTVTNTSYLILNEDGTGKWCGQDLVDITWDDTAINTASSAYSVKTDESGNLIVIDEAAPEIESVYTRLEGKLVMPAQYDITPEHIEDGIYPCAFSAADQSFDDAQDKELKNVEIYTVQTYDIVDMNQLAAGDAIITGTEMTVVTDVSDENGFITVNGGIENGGKEYRAMDEDNCYVFAGMDDYPSYTYYFTGDFPISEDVVFTDSSDLTATAEYHYDDLKDGMATDYFFNGNTSIQLENGAIIAISRVYVP